MKNKLKFMLISIFVLCFIFIFLIPFFGYILKFEEIRKNILSDKVYNLEFNKMTLYDNFKEKHQITFEKDSTYTIYFWATWCKPCIEKIRLEKFDKLNTYFVTTEDSTTFYKFSEENKYKIKLFRMDSVSIPFSPKKIDIYPTTIRIKNDSVYKNF